MAGDVWALGVMFTMMITGASPWQCESLGTLKQLAAQGVIHFKKTIPADLESLIRQMIVVDPMQRLTMAEVENSLIFSQVVPRPLVLRRVLQPRGWQQISHKSGDAFELDDPDDEEKLTDLYTVASVARHRPVQKGVPQRLHRRSAEVRPTFGEGAGAAAMPKAPSRRRFIQEELEEPPDPRIKGKTGRLASRVVV
jgi:serine/threonine protein kinase